MGTTDGADGDAGGRGGYGRPGWCRSEDGVGLACTDFGGTGPDLVLVHATGFCAAVLGPLARGLVGSFHCYGVDLRGHGRSERPPDGNFDWAGFALDVTAVIDHYGLDRPLAFGHSAGGAAVLLAEEDHPGTFAGIYAYEPVMFPSDVPLEPQFEGNPLAVAARRRRETFPSSDEAFANFASKPPLDSIDPDVLLAYVENGFETVPAGDGGDGSTVRLRCRRDDEAAIFTLALDHPGYARLGNVRCPVTLACGALTDSFGRTTMRRAADRLARSTVSVIDGLGHFGPLERPGTIAEAVTEALLTPRPASPS
jgi:pimeloyl-ACP methyl ester carboxylesterase